MSKVKNICVTGGCGFIGSNIAEKICKKYNVRVVDNLSTGRLSNLDGFRDEIDLVVGDLRKIGVCNDVTEGIDVVLHLAALPSVPRSIMNPRGSNENNVSSTVNLLKAAVDNGVKRVVFSASSSAYGNTRVLPKDESMCPSPLSPYAVSKLAGEYYMKAFANCYDIDTVSLRYFNVYGKRQNPGSQYSAVIPKFIKASLNDDEADVYGDGKQSRSFTYIDDVVGANLAAAKHRGDLNGDVFNAALADRNSLLDLVDAVSRASGKKLRYRMVDERVGDVKHSQADTNKAERVLGFKAKVGFDEGIKKTFKHYKGVL